MPQPTSKDVHVDAVLTNISVAYLQKQAHFVAHQAAPIVPVVKQSGKFFTYTKEDWFRDEAEQRADAAESVGSGYNQGTDTYSCDVFSIHKDIGPQAKGNVDAPLDLERDAAEWVTQRLWLRREKQWVTDYFATSIWDTDKAVTNKWSDYANSDPVDDVGAGKAQILGVTGFLPNTMIMSWEVWRQLENHPDLIDRIKHTSQGVVTQQLVAQLFGIDRILVAMAIENTAVEKATATYAFTHGKHALLCFVQPSPSLLAPSAMYTFSWRGVSGGLGFDIGVRSMDIPLVAGGTRVEGDSAFDNKVIASDMGYFFNGVVA